jgi:hypothetical protein
MSIQEKITGNISGHITGVGLPSFLQLMEMEQKTCTIKVFSKSNIGYIYFLNGTLIDANTFKLKHIEALYDILSWKDIVIEVEKKVVNTPCVINLPLMHILMESAGFEDETGLEDESEQSDIPGQPVEAVEVSDSKEDSHIELPRDNHSFCLELSAKLLIDFKGQGISSKSKLIGIEKDEFLIIKAPEKSSNSGHDLSQVDELVIKSLYRGTIYAFRSKVLNIVTSPQKLVFIEYPQRIEHHELRKHKRYKCNMPAIADMDGFNDGVIKNISRGGCLCSVDLPDAGEIPLAQFLSRLLPIKCKFPGSEDEMQFVGEIRNTRKNNQSVGVGVQFIFEDSVDGFQEIVNDYIRLIEYSTENV